MLIFNDELYTISGGAESARQRCGARDRRTRRCAADFAASIRCRPANPAPSPKAFWSRQKRSRRSAAGFRRRSSFDVRRTRFTQLRCRRSEPPATQAVDSGHRVLPEPRLIDRPQGFDLVILLLRRGVEQDQDVRLLANDAATAAPLSLAVEQSEPVGKPHGDLVVDEALPLGVGHRWKRFPF